MDEDPLAPLDLTLADLTAALTPAARRKLAGRIAADLQANAIKRLRANLQPDGSKMEPRKPHGGPQRGRMFKKAASRSFLKKRVTEESARVGFFGAAGRIMTVHQLGLRDRVSDQPGAPVVTYPQRQVIGLSRADRIRIEDLALAQLGDD